MLLVKVKKLKKKDMHLQVNGFKSNKKKHKAKASFFFLTSR